MHFIISSFEPRYSIEFRYNDILFDCATGTTRVSKSPIDSDGFPGYYRIPLAPDSISYYEDRAFAYQNAGEPENAQSDLQKAEELRGH